MVYGPPFEIKVDKEKRFVDIVTVVDVERIVLDRHDTITLRLKPHELAHLMRVGFEMLKVIEEARGKGEVSVTVERQPE